MLDNIETEWTEAKLLSYIANGLEEGLNLDYKACDSLQNTDGKKKELSKDVSAFANSDGGLIIYGIIEGSGDNRHKPERLDTGYNPSDISKEWLEQVINSNIHRRIDGLKIHPVELVTTNPGRFVYVVDIPRSHNAPHQASDKRFYKRFNFSSHPMEEYEIRDVMNRLTAPDLWLNIANSSSDGGEYFSSTSDSFYIEASLINRSSAAANYALVKLWYDEQLAPMSTNRGGYFNALIDLPTGEQISAKKFIHQLSPQLPLFGEQNYEVFQGTPTDNPLIQIGFARDRLHCNRISDVEAYLKWEIQSPGMLPRYAIYKISVESIQWNPFDEAKHKILIEQIDSSLES